MKPSEMLREAARRIAEGESRYGLCSTLSTIAYDLSAGSIAVINIYDTAEDQAIKWLWMVAPLGSYSYLHWFGPPATLCGDQSLRILAACMAAAIAEDDGD